LVALTSLRAKVAEMEDADAVTDAHLSQSEREIAQVYSESRCAETLRSSTANHGSNLNKGT